MLIMNSQRIPFGFHRSLRVTFGQSKQQKEAMRPLRATLRCLPPTTTQLQLAEEWQITAAHTKTCRLKR